MYTIFIPNRHTGEGELIPICFKTEKDIVSYVVMKYREKYEDYMDLKPNNKTLITIKDIVDFVNNKDNECIALHWGFQCDIRPCFYWRWRAVISTCLYRQQCKNRGRDNSPSGSKGI